jgi:hypothetical protein
MAIGIHVKTARNRFLRTGSVFVSSGRGQLQIDRSYKEAADKSRFLKISREGVSVMRFLLAELTMGSLRINNWSAVLS